MLKLINLTLSNIGRFETEQSICFDKLGNLIQVDGQNSLTDGSSGSGKSTVFHALDYLFGINDIPSSVLQSRLTKEKMYVIGEFDFNSLPLIISRGSNGLTIDLNGEITKGSSKLAEEKLDQIIGMPRDLFRKIIHKRQKEGGFFLDFTPKKAHEFLADALNLVEEQKKLDKIDLKIKELEISKSNKERDLLSVRSSLNATIDSISSLGLPPIKETDQETINSLESKIEEYLSILSNIEKSQNEEKSILERQRPKIIVNPYDETIKTSLEEKIKFLESQYGSIVLEEKDRQNKIKTCILEKNSEKTKLNYLISEGNSAKKEAKEIAEHIKKIRDSICPTCEQNWITESIKDKEKELLNKLSSCKSKIDLSTKAEASIKGLDTEIESLQNELLPKNDNKLTLIREEVNKSKSLLLEERIKIESHLKSQNENNSVLLKEYSEKEKILNEKHTKERKEIENLIFNNKELLNNHINKMRNYKESIKRYEISLNSMENKKKEYSEKLSELEKTISVTLNELEMAEEIKKILKSYISCSLDGALETISDSATRILRGIPNMTNATIQLEGLKETKEGKIKEEINAVLNCDGEIGIPIKSLSGGERSSVDLAIDLAVIDFIENETGKGTNFMILDEAFTGLDTQNIEMVLFLLKNLNQNKHLIIVDHNPIIKESVTDRILVIRTGESSEIKIS